MKEKYIRKQGKKYVFDKRTKDFRVGGSFDTLEDAKAVRDIYKRHDWHLDLKKPKIYRNQKTWFVLYKPETILKILYKTEDLVKCQKFLDGYVDMSCIAQETNTNTWRIMKTIHDVNTWFGSYSKLEEAIEYRDKLREKNWDIKYFKEIYPQSETIKNKYIHQVNGKYKIIKTWKEVQRTYGTFQTIEEARKKRDELLANGWKETSQKFLKYFLHKWWVMKTARSGGKHIQHFYSFFDEKKDAEKQRNKFIEYGFPEPLFTTGELMNIVQIGKTYYINKTHKRKKINFPAGKDFNCAIALRDLSIQHDWGRIPVGEYKNNGRTFTIDVIDEKYLIDCIQGLEDKHITPLDEGYTITYNHKSYGIFNSKKEVMEYRDVLVNLKWNKGLLKIIKRTYGGIN